ncbi:MAG: 2-oxoacid:ferredoxin oxidoreductase subunit gamma [Desulfarculus sp.]|jgi:2-oxoglutarate ferredoxin oxidoreductase subunit gamma|nr:MAG: 2-oxoacid:ferredoxin oxidoreductase subunit gamma [Desulfarculus sp.]
MRTELTIAGVGGQGSITAGVILGAAAVTYDHQYAAQTSAYSSELRGGFAAAWVVLSEEPVLYPRVIAPDVLVAQAQDSIERFAKVLKPQGVLIYDSDMIAQPPAQITRAHPVAATSLARNEMQAAIVANMIMLGALCQVTGVVSPGALEKAIADAVPQGKQELNLRAFALGRERVG